MQYDYVGFITAILIAIGGAIGYFKSDSLHSLVAGVVFAILIGIGAYFNSRSPPKPLLEFCVLIILAGLMGYRWYGGKFMPAGVVTCIAVVAFVINMFIYFQDLRNQIS